MLRARSVTSGAQRLAGLLLELADWRDSEVRAAMTLTQEELASLTGGKSTIEVEGATVRQLVDNLERLWPGIRERL